MTCVKSASVLDVTLEVMVHTDLRRVDKHKYDKTRPVNSQDREVKALQLAHWHF